MQKQKVFIPVNPKDELPDNANEKVIVQTSYGLWDESFGGIVKNNSESFRTWLKEQEGYFFTADELIEMRKQDYLNGFQQRSVYLDEIQTPDQYIESLNIK